MPASLIALHCRTSDRTPAAERGVSELEILVAKRLGRSPRAIGEFSRPREGSWQEDLCDSRGCLLEAGGQVEDALTGGNVPFLLAAECSIGLTTLPAVHRHRPDSKILWLDAHGDFNTPETTESGYLGGMGLAGACGRWDAGLAPHSVDPRQVVLAGVRDLDSPEREMLEKGSVTVIGASPVETLVAVNNALDGAPVYVHLDLDVIDPAQMPAQFPAPDGLAAEKLFDVLEAVAEGCELVGAEVTAFAAPDDEGERQEAAATVMHVLEPLLAAVPEGAGVGD
ncbi:MAG: arginase family protein [Thermoleophilaceae bacterium]